MVELKPNRVYSVDFVRGLTMFLMIIANLGFINQPWWMGHYQHAVRGWSGMTYVDMIFPAFMFLVGISIPLAFQKYGEDPASRLKLLGHILIRTASLEIIGVLYENVPGPSMGMTEYFWRVFYMVCVLCVWHYISNPSELTKKISWAVRAVGAIGIVWYISYYSGPQNQSFGPIWWEILGCIGWAYLGASLIYFFVRRDVLLLGLGVLLMIAATRCGQAGNFNGIFFLEKAHGYFYLVILSTLGTIIGSRLLIEESARERLIFFAKFLAFIVLIAALYTPDSMGGLSKDRGTIGWLFWSAAGATALLIVAYIIINLYKIDNFAINFMKSVGSVALTAYIFWIIYTNVVYGIPLGEDLSLADILFYPGKWHAFWGFWATAAMSTFICWLAIFCRKHRLSLHV